MKFTLITAPYEAKLSSIFITDENTVIPYMQLKLKNEESVNFYHRELSDCLKVNEMSVEEYNFEPLDFAILLIKEDSSVKIFGNIAKAIDVLKLRNLVSEFVYKNMLLNDKEEPDLAKFLEENRKFKLPELKDKSQVVKAYAGASAFEEKTNEAGQYAKGK